MSSGEGQDEIVKRLMNDHGIIMKNLSEVEKVLSGNSDGLEVVGALEKFVETLKVFEFHFLYERDVIFPELDRLPNNMPIRLASLEHDDWERISTIAKTHVETALKFREGRQLSSTVETVVKLVQFVKKHFNLEENNVFPMCKNLSQEQRDKILQQLKPGPF